MQTQQSGPGIHPFTPTSNHPFNHRHTKHTPIDTDCPTHLYHVTGVCTNMGSRALESIHHCAHLATYCPPVHTPPHTHLAMYTQRTLTPIDSQSLWENPEMQNLAPHCPGERERCREGRGWWEGSPPSPRQACHHPTAASKQWPLRVSAQGTAGTVCTIGYLFGGQGLVLRPFYRKEHGGSERLQ